MRQQRTRARRRLETTGTRMTTVRTIGARITGVGFTGARAVRTGITGASVTGASITGANITAAGVTEATGVDPGAPRKSGAPPRFTDVAISREKRRQRRLAHVVAVLAPVVVWLWWRITTGDPAGLPQVPSVDPMYLISGGFFLALLVVLIGTSVASGRSPHVVYRPEQIDVRMDDVKGLGPVLEEVQRTIELFVSGRRFQDDMGGRPRRGLLFEGPPGTGKTHMAKAMAAETGVPFLFVSGTSFQSMYYGATARRIRSYFSALRRAARAEGAAIGFIEEIDAIATTRGGVSAATPWTRLSSAAGDCGGLAGLPVILGAGPGANGPVTSSATMSEGTGGVVNELLVQMQSFDAPTGPQRVQGWFVDAANLFLPVQRQMRRPAVKPVNVLLIAATNRADSLDPGLLRPGRFDRRLTFGAPDKAGRREIVDHFLSRKAHSAELDGDEHRDALAGVTQGYTPVMIEHLLDEALVNAVRRHDVAMSWTDVEQARMTVEVGLGQPVAYTDHERQLIATHEAGHAVVAWLVAPERRLEILTIVKRAGSLGLLSHGDREDVYTRSRTELARLIRISFGGQVAEEMFFGDVSTGPGGDLAYATRVAAQMVGQSGMDGTLISFAAGASGGDLVGQVLGDGEARRMVEDLLRRQRDETRLLLAEHRHLVVALRDALLERSELIGHEIGDVLVAAAAKKALPAAG